MSALALMLTLAAPASAGTGLDPQNRVHVGLSMVDGPSPVGFTAGFDSRLSRYLDMDLGLFFSPFSIGEDYDPGQNSYVDNIHLRHGVYVTPGIRFPHPQPRSWAWEVYLHGGGGVVWSENLDPNAETAGFGNRPSPGGTLGADALARFGRFGVRVYGKGWVFGGINEDTYETYAVVRPQYGVEGVVQW